MYRLHNSPSLGLGYSGSYQQQAGASTSGVIRMMNRGVMERQMFAKGVAAFPDLSSDGRVTQKDILMGRGVPMQQGGNGQMAVNDYLGDQTSALAAEAARLGSSEEQLLALLKQQAQPEPPVGMAMGGDHAMAQGVASMMPPEMTAGTGYGWSNGRANRYAFRGS